jgi:hypothetical protein
MANVASPRGLRLGGPLLGCHLYAVSAGYATALFLGDAVYLTTGNNQVTSATTGSTNPVLGAVIGVYDSNKVPGIQASTGERLNYKPASTAAYVLVADHPQQVFIIQSAHVLAAGTTPTAAPTEQIRLIRPVDRVDNDATVTNNDWYVQINYHQRNAGAVGLAVA